MIFVTVGAQIPFDRLVRAVDDWAGKSEQPPPIFAQIGPGGWRPPHLDWTEFLDPVEFRRRVAAATLVVGHAGMGTILTALEFGRPLLVMPRRGDLHETRNDHQVATAARFAEHGVHVADGSETLHCRLDRLDELTPPRALPAVASPELTDALREFIFQPKPDARRTARRTKSDPEATT